MGIEQLNVPDPKTDEGISDMPSSAMINVWDSKVRIFHWGTVLCFAAAWFSAGVDEQIHEYAGYTVAGLLAFRILWGFVGSRYARFRDFVPSPGTFFAYIKSLLGGRSSRHIGHNPVGAVMILALMVLLIVISATGWMMLTTAYFGVVWVEQLHQYATYGLLGLLPLHVGGAILSSYLHRENLVLAMITGRKPAKVDQKPVATAPAE